MAELHDIKAAYADITLVRMLEDLIAAARDGDIVSAAVSIVYASGECANCWRISSRPIALLGELSILMREIQDHEINLRLHNAGIEYGV